MKNVTICRVLPRIGHWSRKTVISSRLLCVYFSFSGNISKYSCVYHCLCVCVCLLRRCVCVCVQVMRGKNWSLICKWRKDESAVCERVWFARRLCTHPVCRRIFFLKKFKWKCFDRTFPEMNEKLIFFQKKNLIRERIHQLFVFNQKDKSIKFY